MTKDEALRLALEFIPSINPAFICEASHHKKHEQHASNEPCPHVAKQKQVYEAIKSALEAQTRSVVKDEPVVWNEGVPAMLPKQKEGETFIVSYEPNQEARDEPVACGACNGSGYMVRDPDIGTDQECFVCEGSGVFEDTTPPQRKPLTNQQIAKILEHGDVAESNDKVGWYVLPYSFARAIEAAHGIKGEA